MNSTPDPAHLQVNYTQSMDHITNYTPQASSLHVNYLMTYMVDHITSAPKSGSRIFIPLVLCNTIINETNVSKFLVVHRPVNFYLSLLVQQIQIPMLDCRRF